MNQVDMLVGLVLLVLLAVPVILAFLAARRREAEIARIKAADEAARREREARIKREKADQVARERIEQMLQKLAERKRREQTERERQEQVERQRRERAERERREQLEQERRERAEWELVEQAKREEARKEAEKLISAGFSRLPPLEGECDLQEGKLKLLKEAVESARKDVLKGADAAGAIQSMKEFKRAEKRLSDANERFSWLEEAAERRPKYDRALDDLKQSLTHVFHRRSIQPEFVALAEPLQARVAELSQRADGIRSVLQDIYDRIASVRNECRTKLNQVNAALEPFRAEERRLQELRQAIENERRAKEEALARYPGAIQGDSFVCIKNVDCCSSGHQLLPKDVSVIVVSRDGSRIRVEFEAAVCPDCRSTRVYFVDNAVAAEVRHVGIPLWREIEWSKYSTGMFDGFNPESVLHQFGYNVSRQGGLTAGMRHDILDFVLDARLYRRGQLIAFLRGLRDRSSGVVDRDMSDAISKWDDDIDYLQHHTSGIRSGRLQAVATKTVTRRSLVSSLLPPPASRLVPATSLRRPFESGTRFWTKEWGCGRYVCDVGNSGFEIQIESTNARRRFDYNAIPKGLFVITAKTK